MATSDGLVAHWKFNEASGTNAWDSVGDNNATTINAPTWTVGKIGNCLTFNGTTQRATFAHTNFAALTTGSVAFWVYPETAAGPRGIFALTDSGDAASAFTIWWVGDDINFSIYENAGGLIAAQTAAADQEAPANTWTHFALSVGAAGNVWYINGSVVTPAYAVGSGTTTNWISAVNNIDAGRIGNRYRDSTEETFLDGSLDDFRVYNRAITAAEVVSIYNNSKGTEASLSAMTYDRSRPRELYRGRY